MIHHVDECLRALLAAGPARTDELTVSFDAPTPAWAAEAAAGARVLNLFLYDVREHLEARAADWNDVRDETGRVVGRRPPTRHYVLSYLVSAWAKTAEEEHRMLGDVLAALPEREVVPADVVPEVFAGEPRGVQVRVAVPGAGAGAASWELWSSLGQPPRASLELVVVAPLVASVATDLAPPAERISLSVNRDGAQGEPPAGVRAAAPAAARASTPDPARPSAERPGGRRWSAFSITEQRSGD